MEAMVELKARPEAVKSACESAGKSDGPPGTSLDGRKLANDANDAVATIGLAVKTLAHEAATNPHHFCGWTDTTLQLQCQEGGQTYEVPLEWVRENLRHGCCICYAAIQSRTIHSTVCLLDWTSRRFTRRHLLMGLSRATSIEKVWLGEA